MRWAADAGSFAMFQPDTQMKLAPILYFDEHWLTDCPGPWRTFVFMTRDLSDDDSDLHFELECRRLGISRVPDTNKVYFESEEARTTFLLAFPDWYQLT